tara:strand:- start:204 stop:431 length:228 start_codon:yes stop_codon:yes gene_type:complete
MFISTIYVEAGLSKEEVKQMPEFINGEIDFYGTSAFQKLYDYFAFQTCEMPYDVAKARTETPDDWILEKLDVELG